MARTVATARRNPQLDNPNVPWTGRSAARRAAARARRSAAAAQPAAAAQSSSAPLEAAEQKQPHNEEKEVALEEDPAPAAVAVASVDAASASDSAASPLSLSAQRSAASQAFMAELCAQKHSVHPRAEIDPKRPLMLHKEWLYRALLSDRAHACPLLDLNELHAPTGRTLLMLVVDCGVLNWLSDGPCLIRDAEQIHSWTASGGQRCTAQEIDDAWSHFEALLEQYDPAATDKEGNGVLQHVVLRHGLRLGDRLTWWVTLLANKGGLEVNRPVCARSAGAKHFNSAPPLLVAARMRGVRGGTLVTLLSLGADVRATNEHGNTYFHILLLKKDYAAALEILRCALPAERDDDDDDDEGEAGEEEEESRLLPGTLVVDLQARNKFARTCQDIVTMALAKLPRPISAAQIAGAGSLMEQRQAQRQEDDRARAFEELTELQAALEAVGRLQAQRLEALRSTLGEVGVSKDVAELSAQYVSGAGRSWSAQADDAPAPAASAAAAAAASFSAASEKPAPSELAYHMLDLEEYADEFEDDAEGEREMARQRASNESQCDTHASAFITEY